MNRLLVAVLCVSIWACQSESSTNNQSSNPAIEQQIESILSGMSLEEKIGQTALRNASGVVNGQITEELKASVRAGHVGAFLNIMEAAQQDELQRIAVEESPSGIPLMFARDVIHGFKTIFPIPLGLAASWEAEQAEITGRVSSIEASQVGINWTFAPMVDICRDSRWGRISESPGEDPLLGSLISAAYVKGFQGDSLNKGDAMAACV